VAALQECWRVGYSPAFGHTLKWLTFVAKSINAGAERSLLTGIQMADEDFDP